MFIVQVALHAGYESRSSFTRTFRKHYGTDHSAYRQNEAFERKRFLLERFALTLQNCALTYLADRHAEGADATVTLDRTTLNRVILRELALPDAIGQGLVKIAGNGMKVAELFGLIDDFSIAFEVVEPLRAR